MTTHADIEGLRALLSEVVPSARTLLEHASEWRVSGAEREALTQYLRGELKLFHRVREIARNHCTELCHHS